MHYNAVMADRPPQAVPLTNLLWTAGICLAVLALGAWLWVAYGLKDGRAEVQPVGPISIDRTSPTGETYVGSDRCRDCHEQEHGLWEGSHHDLAMKPANSQTVLGDFDGATFTHHGVESSFYRRDGKFFVRTEGDDGRLHEYEVLYTFGWTPLQQYLVEFPGGRMQTLPLCWDARPAAKGGQRWFHIYGDERVPPGDPLFWTGPNQNWNYMCAECHSTNLKKNYDPEAERYRTSWSQVNVSCESCHGPGSGHLAWAQGKPLDQSYPLSDDKGLVVRLRDLSMGAWAYNNDTGYYERTKPLQSRVQSHACARCHSRRAALANDYVHGRPIHDSHHVELLNEDLYHAGGQILDEVYVYGSFIQSKMYHNGVRCTDCHDAHSLELHRPGNQLCTQCHPGNYNSVEHHFHPAPGAGTNCVDCHMAERTYMQVDPRRDHSFRVPRPDLSVELGTPNACNDCHDDQTAEWAADYVRKWYGADAVARPHFGRAIHAGRRQSPEARDLLLDLLRDANQPPIVRATGLDLATPLLDRELFAAAVAGLDDDDALVRRAALSNLRVLPAEHRWQYGAEALADPIKSVRMQAVASLAEGRPQITDPQLTQRFDKALEEYVATQRLMFDRAGGYFSLGLVYADLGRVDEALQMYGKAVQLEPWFLPAITNLAELHRANGRADAAHQTLVDGVDHAPDAAPLRYQLGMSHVRHRNTEAALRELQAAVELEPASPRYAYGYAIALNTFGRSDEALAVLKGALEHHPHAADILFALATINRDLGRLDSARRYAEQLVKHWPDNQQGRALLNALRWSR